jgi:hypothetical protein
VVTTDGVRLDGPFGTRPEAEQGQRTTIARLRASMAQEGTFTEAEISAREAAVVVGFGLLVGPRQRFEPAEPA